MEDEGDGIIVEGQLAMSATSRFLSRDRSFYFVLREDCLMNNELCFFAAKAVKDKKKLGSINLDNITIIRANPISRPRSRSLTARSSLPSSALKFALELEDGRVVEFSAPSREEKSTWLTKLSLACELPVENGAADAGYAYVGNLLKAGGSSLSLKRWQPRTFKLRITEPAALLYYQEERLKGQILLAAVTELRSWSQSGVSENRKYLFCPYFLFLPFQIVPRCN